MADQGKPMVFDEENNKMVTVDEYYNSIDTDLRCYNCRLYFVIQAGMTNPTL